MIPVIPSSNFGWVRAFSLAAILKFTKPHNFAHYVCVWVGGGGHHLVNKNIVFFLHVSDHFEQVSSFFSTTLFFQKINYFDGWGKPSLSLCWKLLGFIQKWRECGNDKLVGNIIQIESEQAELSQRDETSPGAHTFCPTRTSMSLVLQISADTASFSYKIDSGFCNLIGSKYTYIWWKCEISSREML